jgi:thiamine biosynthesis lipoprotein
VDCAAELLRDAGVEGGLLHGGTSSCHGWGRNVDDRPWRVALAHPGADALLAEVVLEGESLGVSAIDGRVSRLDPTVGHVIDPHSGRPIRQSLLAAVALPSATESDALSTALLAKGPAGLAILSAFRPTLRALLLTVDPKGVVLRHQL